MKQVCYLNGRYVPTGKARISPFDRGFLFGEGLIETWRTYCGRPNAIADHLARMARSARLIGIPFDPSEPWERRCTELLRRNGMLQADAAVRLTITRGTGPVRLVVEHAAQPVRLMMARPLDPALARAKQDGVAVHLACVGSGVSERWRHVKSVSYLPAILARVDAKKSGCFEAVYHTEGRRGGTVLEGTTSNVFIVRRGVVRTAPISAGLLAGVTRRKTLQLARRVTDVREEPFTVEDLKNADEVFLTASSIEVVPVVRVGRRRIADGRPGPVTTELQRRYRQSVARTLGLSPADLGP